MTGELWIVSVLLTCFTDFLIGLICTENLSALRAQRLESMLPVAFRYGLADQDLNIPLKVGLL